jgi:ATP-dependent RNA helicase DeaD
MTITFNDFTLSPALNQSLIKMGYSVPTPIQQKAIPLALQGKDILGSAQTGTGKTAAFSIPLVEALLRSPRGCALVLTPTRELAKQVLEVIHQLLGHQSPIKTAFIIGGESMGKQLSQLRMRPRIIVGTPGRINDHLERGSLMLNETGFLVLDETDRMLDMGFGVQLDRILKFLPAKRQTLMFSATLPDGIIRLSSKYLTSPERVSVGETNVVAQNIKQDVIRIGQEQKYGELINQLNARSGSVIIFAKTKYGTERMAKNLCRDGFEADALHGDLRQNKRTSVMSAFRAKKFRILVATDIAARGLDVPHIEHVINYDLPQVAEDYIHRMGRTARAGAEGSALCFVSPQDGIKWRAIERLLDPSIKSSGQDNERGSGNHNRNRRPFNKGKPQGSNRFRTRDDNGGQNRNEQRPARQFDDRKSEGRSFEPRSNDKRPSRDDRPNGNRFNGDRTSQPQGQRGQEQREHKPGGPKPGFSFAKKKPFNGQPKNHGNGGHAPKRSGAKPPVRMGA